MDDRRRRFEQLVLPYLDAAYSYARWLSHSSADADDVLQESVLRAFRGIDALRGSDVKSWLLAIVRNCHLTALKQRHRRALVPLPEEHDVQDGHAMIAATADPESESIRHDDRRTLVQLMAELSAEYREILILREIEDLSYREIAAITSVPVGTVMSRLARARAALKVQWSQAIAGEHRAVP